MSEQFAITRDQVSRFTLLDIVQALACPLPGKAGQQRMAPQPRVNEVERWAQPDNCRQAAVLVLLYPYTPADSPRELHLVLTRRAEYPGVHSGQISFPGGRREDGESLPETALRETKEEIGVLPDSVRILGSLTPLYTPPSNFCIFPFIAYCSVRPAFRPNAYEVAEILEPSLSYLLNPDIQKEETWSFSDDDGYRRIPFFDVWGRKVWGATAMILSEFLTLLEHYAVQAIQADVSA